MLLVSAGFLASDFIYQVELPLLLEKAAGKGAGVLWILLSSASIPPEIGQFQAIHDTAKPLSKLDRHEREEVWRKLTELVESPT